jgi:hypothetical protein
MVTTVTTQYILQISLFPILNGKIGVKAILYMVITLPIIWVASFDETVSNNVRIE